MSGIQRSEHPSPGMMALISGRISPPAPSPENWWPFFTGIRDNERARGFLSQLALTLVGGSVYLYCIGMIILAQFLQRELATEVEIFVAATITTLLLVMANTTFDAADPELLWIVKWRLLHGRRVNLKTLRMHLDGDQGWQAFVNLSSGSFHTIYLSLYVGLVKVGPRLGMAFIVSGYSYACDTKSQEYPFRYKSAVKWGFLAGGLGLMIAIQLLTIIIPYLCLGRDIPGPPSSAQALALALREILSPLEGLGSMANEDELVEALGPLRTCQLETIHLHGQEISQFRYGPPGNQSAPTKISPDSIRKVSRHYPGRFRLSYIKKPLGPFVFSAAVAIAAHFWLREFNARSPDGPNVCLGPQDTRYFGGHISAKYGLAGIVQLYGIALGAIFDSIMHLFRWSILHRNATSIPVVETLFRGHALWYYYRFLGCGKGSSRAFISGVISTVASRVFIALITMFALFRGIDSATRSGSYLSAAQGLCWASLGSAALAWLLAISLAWGVFIPTDSAITTAALFRDWVEQMGEADADVGSGVVRVGYMPGRTSNTRRAAVSRMAGDYKVGLYQ